MKRIVAMLLVVASACGATSWRGFPVRQVTLDGEAWTVAVAATTDARRQGLSGVDAVDGVDGMLFEFPEETTARFWMRDTRLDLDIAFFDDDGQLIEKLTMPACQADPCPTYGPSVPYRWALEAPAGALKDLSAGESILHP